MKAVGGCISVVALVFVILLGLMMGVGYIQYNRHCGGYLKLAADSNTIELAKENLTKAIAYCDSNDMTSGNSSVLWNIPQNDVGFWYRNLKSSMEELETVSPATTQLEKTNVLMKLRESLVDNGEKGTSVTAPSNLSVYPYQRLVVPLFWTFVIFLVIGIVVVGLGSEL
ncbi:MAG: hypothetical protein KBC48_03255 [Candidatus Pacebacteria bacterium]|nr:hypothetical protein [Candidatus Paceibacterota bacterium]